MSTATDRESELILLELAWKSSLRTQSRDDQVQEVDNSVRSREVNGSTQFVEVAFQLIECVNLQVFTATADPTTSLHFA